MRLAVRFLSDELIENIIAQARTILCKLGVEIHNREPFTGAPQMLEHRVQIAFNRAGVLELVVGDKRQRYRTRGLERLQPTGRIGGDADLDRAAGRVADEVDGAFHTGSVPHLRPVGSLLSMDSGRPTDSGFHHP